MINWNDINVDPNSAKYKAQTAASEAAKAQAENERIKQMDAMGLNPDGSPKAKSFESLLDPTTGMLKGQYQIGQIDPTKFDSYNMIKNLATGTGLTQSGELNKQAIEQMGLLGKESAARNAASAATAARSGLAMRGGAGAGSRERLALGAQQGLMEGSQAQNRATQGQLLQNLQGDQARRDEALKGFAGMEQGIAGENIGLQKYNIGQALQEVGNKRSYEQEQYKEALDKWSSAKQAEATRASGGGGKK